MRRVALLAPTLALPTVIAFTSGGTTTTTRPAFVVACFLLLAVSGITARGPLLLCGTGGRLVLGGLVGFAGLTALSRAWTVDPGGWLVPMQLSIAYCALLYAIVLQLSGERRLVPLVEPLLAAGTVVVVGYGLLQRGLSDLIGAPHSVRAGGRLFTPISYWNAEGLLAAIGIVLCARIVGDRTRPLRLRIAALAATPILAIGVELSYSRTAVVAVAAGLLTLTLLDRAGSRFQTLSAVVAAGGTGVLTTVPFASLRSAATNASTGAPWLAVLLVTCVVVAVVAARVIPRFASDDHPPRVATRNVLAVVLVAVVALPFATALLSRSDEGATTFGASTTRLTSTGSNRALYWDVAVHRFAAHPLQGDGAGSFASAWLRERTINERVINAHSLWLETAAELGLAGLALLLLTVGGFVLAVRRSDESGRTIGATAALVSWLLASSTDWHWQVPAVTGVAILLIGLVVSVERPVSAASGPAVPSEG